MIDPKAEAYRDHEARPLAEHLADWRLDLIHRGDTPKHADLSTDRIRRLLAVVSGAHPDDVDGKRLTRRQCAEARRRVVERIAPSRLSDLSAAKVQAALARFVAAGRRFGDLQPLSPRGMWFRPLVLEARPFARQSPAQRDRLQRRGRPPP